MSPETQGDLEDSLFIYFLTKLWLNLIFFYANVVIYTARLYTRFFSDLKN